MSQELHYTSVPRGLKPGARGFCTVAHTAGLSQALLERLEGLSGYRPRFKPNDPKEALNPVVWSHLRLTGTGPAVTVISRVGSAGLDYTAVTSRMRRADSTNGSPPVKITSQIFGSLRI